MSADGSTFPRRIDELREQKRQARAQRDLAAKIIQEARRLKQEQLEASRKARIAALVAAAQRAAEEADKRRIAVLKHLCAGLCPKQVARIEDMPLRTVRGYIMDLRKRSGSKSREQLGVWAVRMGHVRADEGDK